jgi:hypothetical protein
MLPVHGNAPLLLSVLTIFGLASQIDGPPNSGRDEANLPSPITGVRISSSFIP